MERTFLTARFDVTNLSEEQRGVLALEVSAQAESSERDGGGHPDVECELDWDSTTEPRVVLVHLNVQLPDDDERDATAVASYLEDALTVGMEGHDDVHGGGSALQVTFALAEEI